jgi:hypothetical protein
MPTPEVMTLSELCGYLKITPPTVRAMIKFKGVPSAIKLAAVTRDT